MSLPIPNLDDKTFEELFAEARALIPRYAPEWTDHNFSDPGITLIDLFAWLAEMQIYSLNRINDHNLLKFLQLLGDKPRPAQSAKVELLFTNESWSKDAIEILQGTMIAGPDPATGEHLVFETEESLQVVATTLQKVVTEDRGMFIDQTEADAIDSVFYFAFGRKPAANNKLYLGFSAERGFPVTEIKLTVTPFEVDLPPVANTQPEVDFKVVPSAILEWQYWNGIGWLPLNVEDQSAAFTKFGRIIFTGPEDIQSATLGDIVENITTTDDKPHYWLRTILVTSEYEIPPRLATLRLNAVAATQGRTIFHEFHASNGLPCQRIRLRNRPVLADTLLLEVFEEDEQWHIWREVPDFDRSTPEDRHFMLDLLDGLILFGDDVDGRIPPVVEHENGNIRATRYRSGGGPKGNLKAETVRAIVDSEIRCVAVTNPQPAVNGMAAESLDAARNRARQDLKVPHRAVTSGDYASLALATPCLRIARVEVLPGYHPDFPCIEMPSAVTIVVVPYILPSTRPFIPRPSQGFLHTVQNHMQQLRLVTTNLHVIAPEFTAISITADISVNPRLSKESLRVKILEALDGFLNPITGGVDGKGWPLGRTLYKSELYEVIGEVEGVTCINSLSIDADGRHHISNGNVAIDRTGLVYPGEHAINLQ